jgi:hypothetical protein
MYSQTEIVIGKAKPIAEEILKLTLSDLFTFFQNSFQMVKIFEHTSYILHKPNNITSTRRTTEIGFFRYSTVDTDNYITSGKTHKLIYINMDNTLLIIFGLIKKKMIL